MSDQVVSKADPKSIFNHAQTLISVSPDEAIALIGKAKIQAEAEKDYHLVCEILICLSRTFRFQGKFLDSIEQLNMAYRLLNRYFADDRNTLAFIFKEYGCLYSDDLSDFTTALDYFTKSLRLNVNELKTSLYNNIGCQYINLKDYKKAYSFLEKGQRICQENEDHQVLCFIYENLGNLFNTQGKYEESIKFYEMGIDSCLLAYDVVDNCQDIEYIHCYIEIGLVSSYIEFGDFTRVPKLIDQVYHRSKSSKLQSALSQVYLLEGRMLLKKNQYDDFKALFNTSIVFCTTHSFYSDKEEWLTMMLELCEKQGGYKEALNYSKRIIINREAKKSKTKAINLDKILENKEIEILKLENRNREIQLQKEQLEQFAYIVAHDLKTPLSNISNFIGLFSRTYREKVDAQHQYYLDFILDNSKHLHHMLDDLLRYINLKGEKGNLPISNPEEILRYIIKSNTQEIEEKNATIEYNHLLKVKMHSFHLEIVLGNLIKNALKFSKKEEAPHIRVTSSENQMDYLFSVIDNGIGIKKEYYQQIFDVFKQLDKINYHGTGMGLSICKKIINTYGGKIWVSGNEFQGTSFHFNIPKEITVEL